MKIKVALTFDLTPEMRRAIWSHYHREADDEPNKSHLPMADRDECLRWLLSTTRLDVEQSLSREMYAYGFKTPIADLEDTEIGV